LDIEFLHPLARYFLPSLHRPLWSIGENVETKILRQNDKLRGREALRGKNRGKAVTVGSPRALIFQNAGRFIGYLSAEHVGEQINCAPGTDMG
jgi:hypothetical protein